jgi:glucose/arabinose dehydrogenase
MLASFVTFMNHRARLALLMCGALAALIILLSFSFLRGTPPVQAGAQIVPPNFIAEPFLGSVGNTIINTPVAMEFVNGKIYIGEKRGRIKEFDSLTDSTPTTILDIQDRVMDGYSGTSADDRGLLSFTFHPNYPSVKYVYALYTNNINPFTGQNYGDTCPNYTEGCVVHSRVSRFDLNSPTPANTEVILVQDFCQQFVSHSVGRIAFGPDGALYVSHGDGANPDPSTPDYGQLPITKTSVANPCRDPKIDGSGLVDLTGAGFKTSAGGAFRAQALQRAEGVTVSLSGVVLRVNPENGDALPDNPNFSHPQERARKIISYGSRNPFRFVFRPGTSELWLGEVGAARFEEINRIISPTQQVTNLGWPCYEANEQQQYFKSFGGIRNDICASFYDGDQPAPSGPYYTYRHGIAVAANDGCILNQGSSISALTFYPASASFPATYTNGLFFGDYARQCVWFMPVGGNGLPDPTQVRPFIRRLPNANFAPVDLKVGPDGYLYVVDIYNSEIVRIRPSTVPPGGNPVAAINVSPRNFGGAPYQVLLSGANSQAAPGRLITNYEWDFTNDGTYDATGVNVNYTYTNPGVYTAKLRVTDNDTPAKTNTVTATISVFIAPTPVFTTPTTDFKWAIGDTINVQAGVTDTAGRPYTLTLRTFQQHCPNEATPNDCHQHFGPEETITSPTTTLNQPVTAENHPYPTYYVLELTAVNDLGGSKQITRAVYPKVVTATLTSNPPGAKVDFALNQDLNLSAPVTQGAIVNSTIQVSALPTQTIGGKTYCFSSWSDGGNNVHSIVIPQNDFNLTVNYSDTTAVNSGSPTYNPNDPCDINLERAITNAVAMGKTEIAFSPSLNLSNGITVSAPITLPTGFTLKGAGGCDTRLKVNATGSAAFILSGGNIIEGLNIETLIGPALRSKESSPGGGNIVRCSSFKVKTG